MDPIPPRSTMQPATAATAVPAVGGGSRSLPPWLADVLGFLTLALAAPGAVLASLTAASVAAPVWLTTTAAVTGGLAGLAGAGAYWARTGKLPSTPGAHHE